MSSSSQSMPAVVGGDAQGPGDHGAQQGGDDADDHREPNRNVLPARNHEPTERADDKTHDKRGDNASDSHGPYPPDPGVLAVD